MSATRNKFMYSEFCVDTHQMRKQKEYIMTQDPVVNDRPAFPLRYNAPRLPGTLLASNSVDVESSLRGIGANNFIFPKGKVTAQPVALPTVRFYDEAPLYIPKLPDPLINQRPLGF